MGNSRRNSHNSRRDVANFIEHAVKITPMEQQAEAPYDWFMDSRFNSSFGGSYHHSSNLDSIYQEENLHVPHSGDNLIKDIGVATHVIEFIVLKNTGNSDAVVKFSGVGISETSGYKWLIGVNEIWASSIAYTWSKLYAYGITGHTKLSYLAGMRSTIGG